MSQETSAQIKILENNVEAVSYFKLSNLLQNTTDCVHCISCPKTNMHLAMCKKLKRYTTYSENVSDFIIQFVSFY